jgi:uncharacterized membrane protein YraQ (UPF0718 family)
MSWLQAFAVESARMLALAAPFLLFGLLTAGLLHVLLPEALILRWMGRRGMKGVCLAALIGVPLPVCSCGVVPITVELRRKGASLPSSLSFLTTTPESSIDSILLTWGLMGPVMAIARPIAAFSTAVLGGAMALGWLPESSTAGSPSTSPAKASPEPTTCGDDCASCGSHDLPGEHSDRALAALRTWRRRWLQAPFGRLPSGEDPGPGLWHGVLRPALRYGFIDLLDDLAFWLLVGILAAGAVATLVPGDLAALGLGGGLMPMILALVVGVPLYMCASASTPIAAALMLKGLGPGAALVFLLAGPATNIATLVLLAKTFSTRFVAIYLTSVVAGALLSGLALEALLHLTGWSLQIPTTEFAAEGLGLVLVASAVVLAVLLVWRLSRGALRSGLRELREGFLGGR